MIIDTQSNTNCDMIKGNELDVTDIVFQMGKEKVQIPLYYIVFSIDKLVTTL